LPPRGWRKASQMAWTRSWRWCAGTSCAGEARRNLACRVADGGQCGVDDGAAVSHDGLRVHGSCGSFSSHQYRKLTDRYRAPSRRPPPPRRASALGATLPSVNATV
jgi:hypothetical protein